MSHVDEGTLATLLDGELGDPAERQAVESHLAGCAACRDQLEQLRTERDKARAILRPAARPAAPAFADVLARARNQAAQKANVRSLNRLSSFAWAATIVVVIGAGWFALRNQRTGPLEERTKASDKVARNEAAPPVVTAAPGARDARGPAPAQTTPAPQPSNRGFADEVRATPPAPAAPAPAPVQELASALAKADEQKRELEPGRNDTAAGDLKGKLAAVVDSATFARRQAFNQAAPAAAEAAAVASIASDAITLASATQRLGRAPLTVPSLPVVGYRSRGSSGIVVIQSLPNGVAVTLAQARHVTRQNEAEQDRLAREATDASRSRVAAGAAARSVTEVAREATRAVDGIDVTASAPISADSLQVLLRAVR